MILPAYKFKYFIHHKSTDVKLGYCISYFLLDSHPLPLLYYTLQLTILWFERLLTLESKLNGLIILLVDDEPDILSVLEEEIKDACPSCRVVKAETYEWA
jgi:hypothetical protein